MKAPKCRLCESEHYSYQPHVFNEVVNAPDVVVNEVVNKSQGVSETVRSHKPDKVGSTPTPATRTKDRHKSKPERLEYIRVKMREYRKRRAEHA